MPAYDHARAGEKTGGHRGRDAGPQVATAVLARLGEQVP
jgi:hypothetical protein